MSKRKIIHIDMDAYFASIEQRDNPQYMGKPIVVGFSGNRGVIAAASYEARKFGIHSAMSSLIASRKCSNLIFIEPRFDIYKKESTKIMEIFYEYTNLVEPLSLDEAYLDVTELVSNDRTATDIALEIKEKIFNKTGLTASAGISYNKFLAKIASDMDKPNGIFVITPHQSSSFLKDLPINKFYGIGKVTAQKMKSLGIEKGEHLIKLSKEKLFETFNKAGLSYYNYVRGIDNRLVEASHITKSVSTETTFDRDLTETKELLNQLKLIGKDVYLRMQRKKFIAKTVTVRIKYNDFSLVSRSKTFFSIIKTEEQIIDIAITLFNTITHNKGIRLMGIGLKNSNIGDGIAHQLMINFNESEY